MDLYEGGKRYWTVMKRFHEHRDNPFMTKAAVKELKEIREEGVPKPVELRINSFIFKHGSPPPWSGPKTYA